ncbi:MAG TPA: hypothetical protein VJ205_00580 [Gammaproteobacteria bacterium]|nr:hypothetical protein [Gammaproteobacteria bacterium]
MTDVIKHDQLVDLLNHSTLFEIFRLKLAFENELDNPMRIKEVKNLFKEGDVIEYFDYQTNNLIKATVLAKKLKYVRIINCGDGKRWKIPYYMLNINSRDFVFSAKKSELTKNSLKVGDWVGFNNNGNEITGKIERLNHKTVTLVTSHNHHWRVFYKSLYLIIEAAQSIQGQVIEYIPGQTNRSSKLDQT